MSRSKQFNISCPSCGLQQGVELYEAINVEKDPPLREALMHNQLNRVECHDCNANFRVDMPLLYSDPKHGIMIHWMPESDDLPRETIIEDFDQSMEQLNEVLPADVEMPQVRLVLSRVELIEIIFMIEAGFNERVVEYVKYSIYTRNTEKLDPRRFRLLLNVEDSTEDELLFVTQDVQSLELSGGLRYGRAAYQSMVELYNENPDEFVDMFPGPCISARYLLMDEASEI